MSQVKWGKEMVDFMRATFDTQMATMATLQNQWEKIFKTTFERQVTSQEEGREMLNEWLAMAKKNREDYRKMMDDSLNNLSGMLKTVEPEKGK
jgi:polyhydroxyalkanoate synthesis regulator phasin